MKIAVTGAAGFIGRHVLSELARHPVKVVAAVRLGPGSNFDPGPATVVHIDIEKDASHAFEQLGKPDVLVHLAWGGLPNYRSAHHLERELPLQDRFLASLIESGLSTLVVTGTCFEYGMQSGELSEEMDARPDNPYALAKDMLRRKLEASQERHRFSLAWARLFYMYGEGQAPNSLLPQLKRAVEQGQTVFNMSGGEQLRDYLPITDIAQHLAWLALHRTNAGIVNICSGRPVSVRALVESWIAQNRWNIRPNLGYYPYPDYEPMEFWGNRSKLDRFLATCPSESI